MRYESAKILLKELLFDPVESAAWRSALLAPAALCKIPERASF